MPEAAAAWVVEYLAVEGVAAVVVSAVVEVAVAAAISSVAQNVLGSSSGQGGTTSPQAMSTTLRQAAASRRLIYGTVKTGGILAYPAQSDDGTYAWLDIYLGEGPIQGISSILWLADELSSDAKFSGLVTVEGYYGNPGQAASAALVAASGGEWTADDVGTGMAHAVVRYQFDRNAFSRGLILPAFMVQGRKVYDPRTSTTAYSANPALCLLDYIRSEFGPDGGIADDLLDFDSFAAAANICDEVLDSIDPLNVVDAVAGKVRRYTLDGVFEVNAGHTSIVSTMLGAMAGAMPMVGGKYRLYAGAWRAPTGPVLTGEFLRAAPSYRTHPARQQRINTVRGTYREPRQDWQTIDFQEQQLTAAVVAEDGEIVQSVAYPATINGAIAQRLARQTMLRARSSVPLSLQCNWAAFQWQLWDAITVSLPEAGASGVYLITGYSFAEAGGIDMVLVPQPASDFEWAPAEHEHLVPTVVAPDFNTTPPGITGLVVVGSAVFSDVGFTQYGLSATWNATVDAFFEYYETQVRVTGSGDAGWHGSSSTTPIWQEPMTTGVSYDFRVRVVRSDGTTGAWAEETSILVNGDTDPPGDPTALSVTGTTTHTVHWTNPSSLDIMRARVYANTVNNPATATEVAEVFGFPSTAYTATHTPGSVPAYYWVEAVDKTGNPSARTYAGTGS